MRKIMITITQAKEFIKTNRIVTVNKNINIMRRKMFCNRTKNKFSPTNLSSVVAEKFIITRIKK